MAALSNDHAVGEEVFEEGDAPKDQKTIHRIRANSTIMQLSKILGESIYQNPIEGSTLPGRGESVRAGSPRGQHQVIWLSGTADG